MTSPSVLPEVLPTPKMQAMNAVIVATGGVLNAGQLSIIQDCMDKLIRSGVEAGVRGMKEEAALAVINYGLPFAPENMLANNIAGTIRSVPEQPIVERIVGEGKHD